MAKKGKGKDSHPSKQPCTMAYAEKRYRQGMREGMELCLGLCLHSLMVDLQCDEEFLIAFNRYFNSQLNSMAMNKGDFAKNGSRQTLRYRDILDNMKAEADLEIEITNDEKK